MIIDEGDMPRLAVACWGHAWLTRRQEGWRGERRFLAAMDEIRDRGFNALRVDPFPHLIAPPVTGVGLDRFELLPERLEPGRGVRRPQVVRPCHGLRELLFAARDRNLKLWLSSAFLPDTQARRNFVRRPRDFIRVWSETLEFIRREGFADTVCAVDFCQEFPAPHAAWGAYRRIFRHHPLNPLPLAGNWSPAVARRAESYLLEVPRALRAAFPGYIYGLSTSSSVEKHLRQMDTSELDFLDYHLWLNDDPQFQLASGELLRHMPLRLAGNIQSRAAGLVWRARRDWWRRRMEQRLEEFLEFCRIRRLEPALTGGFVHFPHGRLDAGLVRELSEWAIGQGLPAGVQVMTPGAQLRPDEAPLWDDPQWIWQQTHHILTGPGR